MKSNDRAQTSQHIEAMQEPPELHDAIIMMVDDEPLMLEVLELYLYDEGYRNFIAVDQSTEAVEIIQREKPDILFLDINMPEVDGFDILQAIRSNQETQHLAVIVLTSATDSATKLIALKLGATDFLEKPIDSSEMALRLRNTLSVKAYQDRLAYYDGLTGLPNRTLFLNRVHSAVAHAQRTDSAVAVMNVSMDRFQNINDSLGPLAGDSILKQAAGRLQGVIRALDTPDQGGREGLSGSVARIGGDEFSVLLPGLVDGEQIVEVSNQILATMEEAYVFEGKEIYSTASIGVARFPVDSNEIELLVNHAAAANELAKQKGRNNCQFYTAEISARANARQSLEADLYHALERQEIQLQYQPQVEAQSGKVIGMESLVRWFHPERGLVPPEQFIPLAEENGLIVELGEWVIQEACRQTRAWQQQGLGNLAVAVNVSPRQVRQDGLPRIIQDACTSSELDPRFLVVELTEGLVMEDVSNTKKLLHELKEIGVSISIDDFGTGYSSLAYLQRFPFDELKIDRSFVTGIPASRDDIAIVKALVAMAHSLGLRVVAEGVETREQQVFLRYLNCEALQGYFFSPALAGRDFREFARNNLAATASN